MVDPAAGPFLFDTSAESWLARSQRPEISTWLNRYLARNRVEVSAVTLLERIRGYSLLWHSASSERRELIEVARLSYLAALGKVWALDASVAIVAAEIMALLPMAPTGVRSSHRMMETRQERLSRWRFDAMIAATALVADLPLIHDNAADFEAIRGAIERSPERFPNLGPLELIRCGSLV